MKTSKLDGDSTNQQEALLALLRQHAPEVFSENKIDVKQLRATLGEEVLADAERYGLNWAGKMDCFRTIQETTTNTLKPVRDESVNFDSTENLFIEGDNLEVLRVLQKSYYGKVKMIYIDPPYNTGNDFIYNDKFSRNKREYLEEVGAIDKEGNVVNAGLYTQNTKDSGHFHSDWLNMMYPRLFLAKNLLRQDGVMFISIDDNEVYNLRTVVNEIFGEENVEEMIWRKSGIGRDGKMKNTTTFRNDHEYVLVCHKSIKDLNKSFEIPNWQNQYGNPDSDPRGSYKAGSISRKDEASNPLHKFYYTVISPVGKEFTRQFEISKDDFLRLDEDKRIYWGKNKDAVPAVKIFTEEKREVTTSSLIEDKLCTTTIGSKELDELLNIEGLGITARPKPVTLIKKLTQIGDDKDGIVIDFFAGSGTTAHAVMQLNAEDGGHRKWICIQLPEKCKPETEAAKAGFVTIADIAKERIRRAGKKIKEENPEKTFDVGFKLFKIDESNFKIWNTHVTSVEQLEQQMIEMFDNVQPGATKEAMMYELILKSGKELNVAIEEKTAGGEKYFRVNDGSLVICLADKLSKELFTGILTEKPKKIIVLDKSFGNDDQLKTNLLLQAEGAGVDEVRVI